MNMLSSVRSLTRIALLVTTFVVSIALPQERSATDFIRNCPRMEDIHPCNCIEIPNPANADAVETVAFCKNIRSIQVLQDSMKGFNGHYVNYFVMDGCKLPPFPNGLFHGIGIGWMEVLNSTMQFEQTFFPCAQQCI